MSTPQDTSIERTFNGWSAKLFASSVTVTGPSKTIYLAGLAANDPEDGHVHHVDDFAGQCRYTYQKLAAILASHEATMANIVKITAYVTDGSRLADYSTCRLEAFGDSPLSAHTFLEVSGLAFPQMLVEVDATVVVPA